MSYDDTPFWRRRRYYLPPAIILLLNAGVYYGITYRLRNKQDILTREEKSLTEKADTLRSELEKLKGEQERVSGNEKIADRVWNDLPARDPGLIEAVAEIDKIARETSVARGTTTYSEDDLENGLVRITATMPVQGSYFDLVGFVNRLERSPRFFLLESVKLNGGQDGAELELGCSVSFCLRKGRGAPAAGGV